VAHGDAIILQALSLTFYSLPNLIAIYGQSHCFIMKGSSRNKFIHTISLSTFHVKKTSPFIKRLSISPFFALYNIKRDIKKRNTFLPLIMHSNITLMKKE